MLQTKQVAQNLKQLRTARGMTQTELADALQISPQSVSKWECGMTVPSIENLCLIAQILQVSVDRLLSGSNRSKIMIGVDGGGSKTEFVLFTEAGELLETLTLGACNPNAVGITGSAAVLQRGIDSLLERHGDVCGIYVGASGFLTGGNGKKVQSILEKAYPQAVICCETDIQNVIAAGTDAQKCVAVICGTGSIVYAKEGDRLTKLSGWGYLLSSSGSGYDIGRDALRAALADREGLGPHTQITQLTEQRLGGPASLCVQEAYRHDQSYIASFAPLVFEAYQAGDLVAQSILEENARALASVIGHAASHYDCGSQVILSGGLLTGNRVFSGMVCRLLDQRLQFLIPRMPQVLGACRLCAKLCGADIHPHMEKMINQYYERG